MSREDILIQAADISLRKGENCIKLARDYMANGDRERADELLTAAKRHEVTTNTLLAEVIGA